MSRQVTISNPVAALLQGHGEQVERMLRGPLGCSDCSSPVVAEEPVCVSVEVYASGGPGQPENLRVFVTHPRCAPSEVRQGKQTLQQVGDLLDSNGGANVERVMILFPDDWPSGVVVWGVSWEAAMDLPVRVRPG